MNRSLVNAFVGFALGAAITAGARVALAPAEDPATEAGSAAAPDSAGAPAAEQAQSTNVPTTPVPAGPSIVDGREGVATAETPRRPVLLTTQDAPIPVLRPNAHDASEDGSARLGKIFAAMDPRDAARVLEILEDHEVRAILSHMSDRNAAAILGHFEPARAATLSRVVLGGQGK
ncbi:MAG: hypothetical protein FWJ74_05860 [Gemmatimonadota bacterium]|jgi:hypothetical protein